MRVNTILSIGQGFGVEIEAEMDLDNARDPITGRGEWIAVSDPRVLGSRGWQPLAAEYEDAAAERLADAAQAFEAT